MRIIAVLVAFVLGTASCLADDVVVPGISPNALGQVPSMASGVAPSTIWIPTATQSISTTGDTSCFSSTGKGSGHTITPTTAVPYQGNTFWLICEGVYTTPAIGTVGVVAKIKWGATTVATATSSGLTASSTNTLQWTMQSKCTLTTVNNGTANSSTVMCWGSFTYGQGLTALSPIVTTFQSTSPVTVDTSAAFKIDQTMALASSLGTENLTAVGGLVEIKY